MNWFRDHKDAIQGFLGGFMLGGLIAFLAFALWWGRDSDPSTTPTTQPCEDVDATTVEEIDLGQCAYISPEELVNGEVQHDAPVRSERAEDDLRISRTAEDGINTHNDEGEPTFYRIIFDDEGGD